MRRYVYSTTVNDRVQELDIAEGLKQLLTDAGFTIDSILDLGYREISEKLHIESYVGKLIVDAAQNIIQKTPSKYTKFI